MKFTGEAFEAAMRQKRLAAGEVPRPSKRARGEGRTEPAQSEVVPGETESVTPPVDPAPAEGAGPSGPGGVVREEGEIPGATAATAVVLDLEEEAPAVAKAPETGRVLKVAEPSTAAGPRTKEVTPSTKKRVAEEESAAKAAPLKQRRGEAGRPARLSAPRLAPPRPAEGEGPPDRPLPRAIPRLSIARDVARATELVMQTTTPESEAEMRQLSCSDIMDTVMVSVIQMCHGALALRSAFLRSGEALAASCSRADKYKKECAAMSQNLSKLQKEGRAREEDLSKRAREAEDRASAAGAELRTAAAREEDLTRRLKHAEDRAETAERAATDAGHEKAGAVAYANEANARAEEAEARAVEAEARATEAEARSKGAEARAEEAEAKAREVDAQVRRAVAEFKSSTDFENEVMEASLHAYVEGFNVCKSKVAAVLKIADTDLEKIQAGDLGEASEEEAGAEGQSVVEGPGEVEKQTAAENQNAAEAEKP